MARLSLGLSSASIDLTRPAAGLSLQIAAAPWDKKLWNILGVDFDNAQSSNDLRPIDAVRLDAYVRDSDLVATYDEVPPRRMRAQIYWRRLEAAEFTSPFAQYVEAPIELIVSVNTSLLDSDPQSSVITSVSSAGQLLGIVAKETLPKQVSTQVLDGRSTTEENLCGFIVRQARHGSSYVEIVHPAESCRSEARLVTGQSAEKTADVKLQHHLFRQRLEKGVILRARIRAALVARQHDEAAALDAYQHFAAAEPPLTV